MNPNIDPDTINFNKLREDRRELDEEIRALKKELRSPWGDTWMGAEQNQLRRLKAEATSLCILRAYLRGKQHLSDEGFNKEESLADYCREEAQRLLPQYTKPKTLSSNAEASPEI